MDEINELLFQQMKILAEASKKAADEDLKDLSAAMVEIYKAFVE